MSSSRRQAVRPPPPAPSSTPEIDKDRHINFLGRYLFNIKASGPGQGLRPLRDPDAVEDDAD
ncbi:hypothetical protein TPA0910_11420 [Streptomyces hygroscopicus subsp. sporocinereus]|uniref:Uncharacterized protein n=2 Tax=Streptomyces hygroscopicus TaxID=1912 RepID=A0ABQ3TTS5_STRHY|nr:hypothetical protein TPA0910_11420 [Streptomyces hygroscopicus]GLV75965.1 hypothetical protein Shyhy02_39650 [Streptomyces hygroscopicus subsp. hygroscopicus]